MRNRLPIDVHEAFREIVHGYGVPEMAAKMGVPTGTLYNKANLNDSTNHRPSLADAILVQTLSGDNRIVEAMAHTLGGVFVKLPKLTEVSDVALLEVVAEISIQSGLFHKELRDALADGKFSRSEHSGIHRRSLHFITAVLESVKRIEGLIDE